MQPSHHIAVHRILTAHAAPCRAIAPGTDGAIGRAQFHFDSAGNAEAVALLGQSNVALVRLRQALCAGDEAEAAAQREALARLASAWLGLTPLFQIAELLCPEGHS